VMSHHVSTKATLYDMQIDATGKYAAVACQDRKVRIYNINSGKLTRSYKASLSDEGTLIKIELDRSGLYAATSGSNKVLCLYDFYSGQCIASMYGHSELVTDVKFTRDITRLISVSGDSCIFVWKLAPSLTQAVQERMTELSQCSASSTPAPEANTRYHIDQITSLAYLTHVTHSLTHTKQSNHSIMCSGDEKHTVSTLYFLMKLTLERVP
jgi:WD40 repeat protein